MDIRTEVLEVVPLQAHFNVYYSERKFERASWMPLYRFMSQSFGDLDGKKILSLFLAV